MFILRKISGQNRQSNRSLGEFYTLVDKVHNPADFKSCVSATGGSWPDTVYAFVTSEDGKHFIPLYSNQENYIMTESGKTFANVSKK